MADNFGPEQPRVLNVQHRSLDNVVFQYRKPPLTAEWNLINQISNEKIQEISKASYPSGWLTVGEVLQDGDSIAITGQVNCSATYEANSFKLYAKNDNIAIVNGWPILVQGTNSPDSDNIIRLGEPAGQLYDFVYLEVWRQLVGKDDPIYPCGNVLANPYPFDPSTGEAGNEIEWPAIGTETTKRVQIQYRIRVKNVTSYMSPTSDGFDIDTYPIGGRTSGQIVSTTYAYRKFGAADIGLYISSNDSDLEESKSVLNTVDGYVYAIPMFMVARRIKQDTIFTPANMRGTFVGKTDLAAGYVPDRPDSMLADVIYKTDIVDFRHQVLNSGKDVENLLDQTIAKLVAGELTTALKPGFGLDGAAALGASFGGGTLVKAETINVSGSLPSIGVGSNTLSTAFKRRAFCNAELEQDHNVINLGAFAAGATFNPETLLTLPDGHIFRIDGFYNASGPVTDITPATPRIPSTFTVGAAQTNLMMEFTIKYDSSSAGFKDVPKEFIEVNKGTYLPIATRDRDIPIRFNNGEYLLNFTVPPSDPHSPDDFTDPRDCLRYKGGNYTEDSAFGQEMVLYRTTNGSGVTALTLDSISGKYNGYYILGVKSVELQSAPNVYTSFTAQRTVVESPTSYVITNYSITTAAFLNAAVKIVLYVGSKPMQSVGAALPVEDSLKFFELSKQGRGILDTYELIEVVATEEGGTGTFWVDTIDKPIIAIAAKAETMAGYAVGTAYAWNSSGVMVSLTTPTNKSLPVLDSLSYTADLLPTKIRVTPTTSTHGTIRVPVLVHSYVTQAETPYTFFYKTNAYQGLLDTSTIYSGKVIKESSAIITTMGSGAVSNYTYNIGNAVFQTSSRSVLSQAGVLTRWSTYIKPDYYLQKTGDAFSYRIINVSVDITKDPLVDNGYEVLTLAEVYTGASGSSSYAITRVDVSHDNISNVVDRLPALKITASSSEDIVDYQCYSDNVSNSGLFFHGLDFTTARQKMHDPLNTLVNDFVLGGGLSGSSVSSKRGRNDFVLTAGQNNIFKLSDQPRPHIIYDYVFTLIGHKKKVYQMYLFNQSAKGLGMGQTDLTGRLYLMVISGETTPVDESETSLNGFFNRDTVDLYELVGRPIVKQY
jgi:hypothetical protein